MACDGTVAGTGDSHVSAVGTYSADTVGAGSMTVTTAHTAEVRFDTDHGTAPHTPG